MLQINKNITITGQATEEDFLKILREENFYNSCFANFQIGDIKFTIQTAEYNPLESCEEYQFLNFLNNYNIGVDTLKDKDNEEVSLSDMDSIDSWINFFEKNDYFYVKVYGYEHSGIALSIGGESGERSGQFTCPFDSGTAGFLVIKKDDLRRLRGVKRLTPKILKDERKFLSTVVDELENYLEGRQYEAIIEGQDFCESELIECPEEAAKFFADFFNQNKAA